MLIVDHTTDNTLVTFRFQHAGVKMSAAEQAFEAGGHKFAPGAFVIAERGSRRARAVDQGARPLGLGGRRGAGRADARPRRAADRLHPHLDQHAGRRLGPAWRSTTFKVPYTYFADNLVRQGNLKQKYDVIIFPHAGGAGTGLVYGGVQGNEPRPYKKTADTPHLGIQDSTDDMRGGLGYDGLQELMKFVQEGGVLHHRRGHRRRSSRSST